MGEIKIKKFKITEHYCDLCFFKREIIIKAEDEKHAEEIYYELDDEDNYTIITDEIFERKNDPQLIDIEHIQEID